MSGTLDLDSLSLTEIIRLQDQLSALVRRRFERHLALVFSDIVGSTHYFSSFGDEAGGRLQQRHVDLILQALEAHMGRLVDRAGDGAFLYFPTVEQAVQSLIRFHQLIVQDNLARPAEHHLHVRSGLHWGPVLTDGSLVTGDAVNLCARMTTSAGPGQIRLTRAAFHELPKDMRLQCRPVSPVCLKGIAEPIPLMRLEWKESGEVPTIAHIAETGETITLPDQDVITFGRLQEMNGVRVNDVVLALPDPERMQLISRWHFELRKGVQGMVFVQLSSQKTEVDGKPMGKGAQALIHDGSVARLSGVMTLRFVARTRKDAHAAETISTTAT